MIKVSAFYPWRDTGRFDFGYYCKSHIPMVRDKLGAPCKGIAVERGVAGAEAGATPRFIAAAHFFFESTAAFEAAFSPHAAAIFADAPNYTDLTPEIQVSEVLINATRGETGELHVHVHGA